MSEPIDSLRFIARMAGRAIEREREQRHETGVSWSAGRIETLLLYLTIIKGAAHEALPEIERAALPPEKNSELVRRLAQEILEEADERLRKRPVVH
jgi:hypothetical protein